MPTYKEAPTSAHGTHRGPDLVAQQSYLKRSADPSIEVRHG